MVLTHLRFGLSVSAEAPIGISICGSIAGELAATDRNGCALGLWPAAEGLQRASPKLQADRAFFLANMSGGRLVDLRFGPLKPRSMHYWWKRIFWGRFATTLACAMSRYAIVLGAEDQRFKTSVA